jgi:hypothetical protein
MSSSIDITGVGVLRTEAGAVLYPNADYALVVSPHSSSTEPWRSGRIVNPPEQGFALGVLGVPLTLELEDGRQWACALATTDGLLTGRGPADL